MHVSPYEATGANRLLVNGFCHRWPGARAAKDAHRLMNLIGNRFAHDTFVLDYADENTKPGPERPSAIKYLARCRSEVLAGADASIKAIGSPALEAENRVRPICGIQSLWAMVRCSGNVCPILSCLNKICRKLTN